MLQSQPIEFFLRALPEGFLFLFAIYSFSKIKINIKKYVISSIISAIIIFLVRMLPISYGVHTILAMGIVTILAVYINKIDIIKSIKSVLIFVIFQFLAEGINIFIIQNIYKVDINEVFSNVFSKAVYGLPSLIILCGIISVHYIVILKKDELTYV
ncbi:MAG: hypothetical protein RSC24_13425 [Clostridium sp.]